MDQDELERNIQLRDNPQAQKRQLQKNLASYEKKRDEYAKAVRALYMDKVKGIITEGDHRDMSRDFSAEQDRYERLAEDCRRRITELDARAEAGDGRKAIVERYANLEHLTREMVEALIDHVAVGKRVPGTRDVPVEIHWNF